MHSVIITGTVLNCPSQFSVSGLQVEKGRMHLCVILLVLKFSRSTYLSCLVLAFLSYFIMIFSPHLLLSIKVRKL